MKKFIIENEFLFNVDENFGNVSVVKNEKGESALYDKLNGRLISQFFKLRDLINKKNYLFLIDTNNNGYIYDLENNIFVAYNEKIKFYNKKGLIVYYDSKKELYCMFHMKKNQKLDFKKIEIFEDTLSDKSTDFLVSNGKGYGLYHGVKCLVPVDSAKEISFSEYENYIVETFDNKKYYICYGTEEKSKIFDDICEYDDFIIGKDDEFCYCYQENNLEFSIGCDDLKYIGNDALNEELKNFIVKIDGTFGIIQYDEKSQRNKLTFLVEPMYDNIECDINLDGLYYLVKKDKVGLFYADTRNDKYKRIPPEFDEIMYKNNVFITQKENKKQIFDFYDMKVIENDIDNIILDKDDILFEKNGKKGIVNLLSKSVPITNLDDIKNIFSAGRTSYYIITKNDSYGMIFDGNVIIPIEENQYIENFNYNRIFAIYNVEGTKVCRLSPYHINGYEVLYSIPEIYRVEYLGSNLFDINGTIYQYNGSKPPFEVNHVFSKSDSSNLERIYYALYELENGSIFSATNDRVIHEEFEKSMEETPEEEIEKILVKMKK